MKNHKIKKKKNEKEQKYQPFATFYRNSPKSPFQKRLFLKK
jgi:hypothetical protein